MSALEKYIDFLPEEGQKAIQQFRQELQEPLSIVSGIHWVSHHKEVPPKLAKLIIVELNKILLNLNASNYSTCTVKTVAALTLAPDRCYEECFGAWEDYAQIQGLVPILEMKSGRPINLRPLPEANISRPLLWRQLQGDAFRRKITSLLPGIQDNENR
tara:strand:- start:8210 stop:8683 length:474 start_codon:yes stop_codon:yes gene_type:complete